MSVVRRALSVVRRAASTIYFKVLLLLQPIGQLTRNLVESIEKTRRSKIAKIIPIINPR